MNNNKLVSKKHIRIAVIGLGYVGLPLAVAFAKQFEVIGFDINEKKINEYRQGIDRMGDLEKDELPHTKAYFTSDEMDLSEANFYIVAVPTPISNGNVPDLKYVEQATELIGKYIKFGDTIVYESTVYPGVTEETCLPILEKSSGMKAGIDFKIGYSPERINPGDKERRLQHITKIVSGCDEEALEQISAVYGAIIEAGVYKAPSIRIAEAAKVIENAQRDVNIAFMNELAMLFQQINISTKEVIKAASTKWNFIPFTPGLVGGHCIGIDPYYLTYKAEDEGLYSNIILNSRHINDNMAKYVANLIIKKIMKANLHAGDLRLALLGLTYKENSTDIRNSKVVDVVKELKEYGITPILVDPVADPDEVMQEYGISLTAFDQLHELHAIAIMVPHEQFLTRTLDEYFSSYKASSANKLLFDLKGIFEQTDVEALNIQYWCL